MFQNVLKQISHGYANKAFVVFIVVMPFFAAVFDSRSSFVLCSETARKRLLRRLPECGMGSEDRLSPFFALIFSSSPRNT